MGEQVGARSKKKKLDNSWSINFDTAEVAKQLLMDLRSRYYFLVAMRFWETPVHIPNTMVKTKAADDTILVTVWESRWLPD